MAKAIVRQEVEKLPGVTGSWFEWDFPPGGDRLKTLVVEVDFDTDPNEPDHGEIAMDDILRTAKETLLHRTTMDVHHVRIVPKR